MTLYQLWMACVAVSLVLVAVLLIIDRIIKLRLHGWKVVDDCEHNNRYYLESRDGVRLIVEDGKIIGWYRNE